MAYALYHVNGIVLGGINIGEGHRLIDLFTEEFGLVRVAAKSARENRSKMRYHIQDYTRGRYTLIRGREQWKLTGAHGEQNIFYQLITEPRKQMLFAAIAQLLRRLLPGEETNAPLFAIVDEGVSFLRGSSLSPAACDALERVMVLRILHALGYVSEEAIQAAPLLGDAYSPQLLDTAEHHARELVSVISVGLEESHL